MVNVPLSLPAGISTLFSVVVDFRMTPVIGIPSPPVNYGQYPT